MARKPRAYVFDAWAMLAYLEDEPSAAQIADMISTANEQDIPLYLAVVNAGEVWGTICRELSEAEAETAMKELRNLRIRMESVDWELAAHAALLKFQYGVSYVDAFAAALASIKRADLVTGNSEMKPLETLIKIHWL